MKRIAILLLAVSFAAAEERPKVWVRVPADDLMALFPKKGAGFLISIEEYEKLLRLATENETRLSERAPVPARLVRGAAKARVLGDALHIEATWTAVVAAGGPGEVPFAVEGAAIEEIRVGGGELAGTTLRFPAAGTYEVSAVLSARLEPRGDARGVELLLPPASAQTVDVEIPGEVEGETGPIVRAFKSGPEGARVVGYPDGQGRFTLWFRPKARAFRLEPLLSASFAARVEIGEARTSVRTTLHLEVLRAPMERVELSIPAGLTIADLGGKGIKSWAVRRSPQGDVLEIVFVEPLLGAAELTLEAEQARDGTSSVDIPVVRVPAAVRYRGTVAVASQPEVRITALVAEGARRLVHGDASAVALFEVWSPRGSLRADVEQVVTKTTAQTLVMLAFLEEGKSLRARIVYSVRRQSLYRLEPVLPPGWIVRGVRLDGMPVEHTYEPDGRLVLVFPAGLKPGEHFLDVAMYTDEPEWVPATGSTTLEVAGPRSGVDEEAGYWVVASDPAFRVAAEATNGVRAVGIPEIEAAGFRASDRILFAWRFESGAYAARFRLERHSPQVSATVVTRSDPGERTLDVRATVFLDIERAGVRELKIALPKGTGPLVDIQGAGIKEKRAPEKDADPEVWTLVLQRRVRGRYRVDLAFEKKMETDSWSADVPEISVPGAAERGFVVVEASPTTAISVERNGLREADVAELPEPPARPPLEVLAYAAHPYRVRIASRRHDPKEVVQAVALSASIYGVLSADGALRCRAEYRVRNNDQPFLFFDLPAHSDLLAVIVNGEPAKPLVEANRLKLPLPRSRERTEPFIVAIVYETRGKALEGGGEVLVQRPRLDIDVLKTEYSLHLPRGYRLEGHDGDLVPITHEEQVTVLASLSEIAGHAMPFGTRGAAGYPASDSAPMSGDRRDRKPRAKAPPRDGGAPPPETETADFDLEVTDAAGIGDAQTHDELSAGLERSEEKADAPPPVATPMAPEEPAPDPARPPSQLKEPADAATLRSYVLLLEERLADANEVNEHLKKTQKDFFLLGESEKQIDELRRTIELAKAGQMTPQPTPKPGATPRPKRMERALLSLDIQFLRSDNIVRLESFAPTGAVMLAFAADETHEREAYLGVLLGAVAGIFLFGRKARLLRVLGCGVLLVLAIHFGGLSFLPIDLALGAAQAFAAVLVVTVLWRLARKIRFKRRAIAVAAPLLLLALAARAGDEVISPYDPTDPNKVERVFLDAKEYHRLRALAYPEDEGRRTTLVNAEYLATLKGEELTVLARYGVWKETEDAERIPLGLKDVAVASATLDGKPANVSVAEDGLYLALSGKGRFTLELLLRPILERDGETRAFAIPVRPAPAATLRIEHDRPGHEVTAAALGRREGDLWRLGPVGVLAVTLEPRTEGFVAPTAELRAETQAVAAVRDGYTGIAARIRYGISGGKADHFRVRVDKSLVVRSVSAPDLAGWEVGEDGILMIALTKPAENALTIDLVAERPAERERTETFPEIAPLDVLRDAGVIAIDTLPDLKVELLDSQGLLRAREADAPQGLGAAPDPGAIHSVHRFAVRPFRIEWKVTLEPTLLRASSRIDVAVGRERVDVRAEVSVILERGPGPFSLRVRVPSGWEVLGVTGDGVRDFWLREGVLHVERAARQQGTVVYVVELTRRLDTRTPFEAPALELLGAAREAGTIRIGGGEGLEVDASDSSNLLPEDVAKVGEMSSARLLRAFKFVSVPWRVVLKAREEPREVEAIVVSRVVPLDDRLRVETLVHYYARRGLIDSLTFSVPVAEESGVYVSAPDLREERSAPEEGGRRYTLSLRTPTRGSASASVTYHVPYGTALRGVDPLDIARVKRYVVVEKVSHGEVRIGEVRNLDAGVFEDLPFTAPETTPRSVARVYVGSESPFSLVVNVKWHAFEDVAKSVIHRASAQALVDRTGWVRVRIAYRIYNRTEQFLRVRLPSDAQLYSVFVAGEGVRPLHDAGRLLIPLRKVAIGAPTFDVEVIYAYSGPAPVETQLPIRLPEVDGIDVRRTTLSLYLPKGFDYDFDTEMERVDAANIAAYEASDVYQEIKDSYAVAQRGNRFQAERALENARLLEREASRLQDKVKSMSKDSTLVEQVTAQQAALGKLRQEAAQGQSAEGVPALALQADEQSVRRVTDWSKNAVTNYGQTEEDRKQLEDFSSKQARYKEADQVFGEGRAGGKGGGADDDGRAAVNGFATQLAGLDDITSGLDDNEATFGYESGTGGGGGGLRALRFSSNRDDEGGSFVPPEITTAKGRISIKIDLPFEGESFHFAQLGPKGSVALDASERGGRFLEGLLAVLLAAGAAAALKLHA